MPSMLEQAIIDAASLREAALKNAEQAIIEKYAPEIKNAVETMLQEEPTTYGVGSPVRHGGQTARITVESDNGQIGIQYTTGGKTHLVNESELEEATEDDIIREEEGDMAGGVVSAAPAGSDMNIPVGASGGEAMCPCPDEEDSVTFEFSMDDFKDMAQEEPPGEPMDAPGLGDLGGAEEEEDPLALQEDKFQEILNLIEEIGKDEEVKTEGSIEDAYADMLTDPYNRQGLKGVGGPGKPKSKKQPKKIDKGYVDVQDPTMQERSDDPRSACIEKHMAKGESRSTAEQICMQMGESLEEELVVDMGQEKGGWIETNEATLQYQQEMELAQQESTKYKEENEELEKKLEELDEAHNKLSKENELYENTIYKLNQKVKSTLLSNAKLLYTNRALKDASLNERQKTKIAEAIQKARNPEEAKALWETLKTTVGSSSDTKKGPQSLSESVNRRSNLSSMLPRRNNNQSTQVDHFSERMKKLAGIK